MSRFVVTLLFLFMSVNANACVQLIQNHKYLLSSGVEYCLESEYSFAYIFNSEFSLSTVEVSDVNKEIFELIYPGEKITVPDQFNITTFENVYLSVFDGILYLETAPKSRRKRSIGAIGKVAAGTAAAGGDFQLAPTIIGTVIGTGLSLMTGPATPITGPFLTNAIIQNITSNQGKPRPPLTITGAKASNVHNNNRGRGFPGGTFKCGNSTCH
ncbi:hypothetical protein [Photobacterium carnosum]|uniref:hypothetical protein n=1 Tax=Photobacterium carnosum TaxID=2023717 RepID=UPI001E545AB6|nr:hypothetical protein [Photobacterium carnosum]MCD9528448.1 hypothetical protein [Photobacterium carnosum]